MISGDCPRTKHCKPDRMQAVRAGFKTINFAHGTLNRVKQDGAGAGGPLSFRYLFGAALVAH
jgi:hypothetical protein